MSYKAFNQPCIFISKWSEEFGPKVVEFQPKGSELDLETITMQLFIAYQNFYFDDKDKEIERIIFKFPFKNISRKSRIFLDSLDKSERAENPQAFIVGILFPDYFPDDLMEKFDNILVNVGEDYLNNQAIMLENYYEEIYELFTLEQKVQDSEIVLEEDYAFPNALLDFKKGIEQFSKKNYHPAYFLLRKAYLKFKAENKIDLILETTFALSSALTQLQKYDVARRYYDDLENLANQLQHKKYYETAVFMSGVCAYKSMDYLEAIKKFSILKSKDLEHINQFNYYYLYGQVLRLLEMNANAIMVLLKAFEISEQMEKTEEIQEKQGKLLLELGHTNYNMAIAMKKSGKVDEPTLRSFLNNSVDYYKSATEVWSDLNRFSSLIFTHQLIGNIYEYFEEHEAAVESYRKALEYAETSNDVLNRLKSFKLIIQTLSKLELHEILVKEIDEMLAKIRSYAFIDLYTISGFHRQLGESLHKLGKSKEALSELLIALTIYNKFEEPVQESLDTLQNIIDIYSEENNEKYINYYQGQYDSVKAGIKDLAAKKKKEFGLIGDVREIWIFMDMGTQIFSHSPETTVDPQLFGGYLSALTDFSKELTSDYLNSMTIGTDRYVFYREEDKPIFILSRSNITTSMDLIEKILTKIYNEFWNQYSAFLVDFDDVISRFSTFEDILEKMDFREIYS